MKKTLKFLVIGLNVSLSFLGLASIILIATNINRGTSCGITKQKQAHIILYKLDQALSEFKLDLGVYPKSLSALTQSDQTFWMGPYIKTKELIDPWGELYRYQYFPNRYGYQLFTLGSDHLIGGTEAATDQISKNSLQFIQKPSSAPTKKP